MKFVKAEMVTHCGEECPEFTFVKNGAKHSLIVVGDGQFAADMHTAKNEVIEMIVEVREMMRVIGD